MTKIKICGIRDIDTAIIANEADFMGFIMHDQYKRYCPPDTVKRICREIKGSKKVGVFVDQPLEEVNELAEYCSLDYVQLHGHEGAEYAAEIKKPVIKAFRYGEDFSLDVAQAFPAEIILIDSYSKNAAGGTGISFAWKVAAKEIRQLKKPYMIAGGISAQTIQEVINLFTPFGIDASGSMEINGIKSPKLINEFFIAAGKRVRKYERLFS